MKKRKKKKKIKLLAGKAIYTYIYESKYGLKSDSMKVAEKQSK